MTAAADPRVERYARLLLERSIGVRPGWQVLVHTTTEARPLAQALSRVIGEHGAYTLPRISFGASFPCDLDWIAAAPPELAALPAPLEREVLERADAAIFVLAPEPDQPALDEERYRAFRSHVATLRDRGRTGAIPAVRCDFPCRAFAERADMSLEEFTDAFYAACLRDWDEEARLMAPIAARLRESHELRVVAAGTDLKVEVDGRGWEVDDGHLNVPGGEIFTSPVEESVEGTIHFAVPSFPPGGAVHGATIVFRGGAVVEARAEVGDDVLARALGVDAGARRAGEFGIGCNRGIERPMRSVLFDEKMAGTVHVALGSGFPKLGGRNTSDLHWDLVCDLRRGGELLADGETIQRDGEWLL